MLGKTVAAKMNLVNAALDHRFVSSAAVALRFARSLWCLCRCPGSGLFSERAGFYIETDGSHQRPESENRQARAEHGLVGIVTECGGKKAESDEDDEASADNQPCSGFLRHFGLV